MHLDVGIQNGIMNLACHDSGILLAVGVPTLKLFTLQEFDINPDELLDT